MQKNDLVDKSRNFFLSYYYIIVAFCTNKEREKRRKILESLLISTH